MRHPNSEFRQLNDFEKSQWYQRWVPSARKRCCLAYSNLWVKVIWFHPVVHTTSSLKQKEVTFWKCCTIIRIDRKLGLGLVHALIGPKPWTPVFFNNGQKGNSPGLQWAIKTTSLSYRSTRQPLSETLLWSSRCSQVSAPCSAHPSSPKRHTTIKNC